MTTYTNDNFEFIKSLADLKHELEFAGHKVNFTYDSETYSFRLEVE